MIQAKEKAEKLIRRMQFSTEDMLYEDVPKECALIAVDESFLLDYL